MSTRRRFLHPIWLMVSLPGYIGWRLLPALTTGPVGLLAGVAVLLAACALIPFSVGSRSTTLNRRTADRIAWIGLTTMGFFSTLFVMTVLRDGFLLAAHLVLAAPRVALLRGRQPGGRWD